MVTEIKTVNATSTVFPSVNDGRGQYITGTIIECDEEDGKDLKYSLQTMKVVVVDNSTTSAV